MLLKRPLLRTPARPRRLVDGVGRLDHEREHERRVGAAVDRSRPAAARSSSARSGFTRGAFVGVGRRLPCAARGLLTHHALARAIDSCPGASPAKGFDRLGPVPDGGAARVCGTRIRLSALTILGESWDSTRTAPPCTMRVNRMRCSVQPRAFRSALPQRMGAAGIEPATPRV